MNMLGYSVFCFLVGFYYYNIGMPLAGYADFANAVYFFVAA